MKRRNFITLVSGAVAWPLISRAQQPTDLRTIGFLGANSPSVQGEWVAAFVKRLRELDWIEGRNVAIEYRWGEGQGDRSPGYFIEFARLKVDIIVTHGTANTIAAMRTTSTIPIVFAAISDPVGDKIVASLGRPGGNVTGMSNQSPATVGKRVELLREVIPGLRRLAVLANASSPVTLPEIREVRTVAEALGIEIAVPEIWRAEHIAPALGALKGRADAIYVQAEPLFNFNRVQINALALSARMPTVVGFRPFADAGGLISYGPNFPDLFGRAAEYVDKVLRGAKPGELPVQQPTKFELVINLKAAKALDLTISGRLLARADVVIE
jgi:putative tryptophan/tyrosine transport system substrate-binding protein